MGSQNAPPPWFLTGQVLQQLLPPPSDEQQQRHQQVLLAALQTNPSYAAAAAAHIWSLAKAADEQYVRAQQLKEQVCGCTWHVLAGVSWGWSCTSARGLVQCQVTLGFSNSRKI